MAAILCALEEAVSQLCALAHDEQTAPKKERLRSLIGKALVGAGGNHWWCKYPAIMTLMLPTLELPPTVDGASGLHAEMTMQLGQCRSCVNAYHSTMPSIRVDLENEHPPASVKAFFHKVSHLDAMRIGAAFLPGADVLPSASMTTFSLGIPTALYEILSNHRLWSDLRIIRVVSKWLSETPKPIKDAVIDKHILRRVSGLLQWFVCPEKSIRDWITLMIEEFGILTDFSGESSDFEVLDEWLHVLASQAFNMSLLDVDLSSSYELSMFLDATNCAETPTKQRLRSALRTMMTRMNEASLVVLRASLDSLPDFAVLDFTGNLCAKESKAASTLIQERNCAESLEPRPCGRQDLDRDPGTTPKHSQEVKPERKDDTMPDLASAFLATKKTKTAPHTPSIRPFYRSLLQLCMASIVTKDIPEADRLLAPLPDSFKRVAEYTKAFLPLLLEECREGLQRHDALRGKTGHLLLYISEDIREMMRCMSFIVEATDNPLLEQPRSRSSGKGFHQGKHFRDGDVVLLHFAGTRPGVGSVKLIGVVAVDKQDKNNGWQDRFAGRGGSSGAHGRTKADQAKAGQDIVQVQFLNDLDLGSATSDATSFDIGAVTPSKLSGTQCRVATLGNVVTSSREYAALQSVGMLPDYFKTVIATSNVYNKTQKNKSTASADRNVAPRYIPPKLWETMKAEYNESQLQAIHNVLNNYSTPISLLQGPPGTGKTKTILGLVSGFLSFDIPPAAAIPKLAAPTAGAKIYRKMTKQQALSASLVRQTMAVPSALPMQFKEVLPYSANILLCAASNGAVDELVFRVVRDGLWNREGEITQVRASTYYQEAQVGVVSIVRLGEPGEDAPEMVKAVCLWNIIKREIKDQPEMVKLCELRNQKRMLLDLIKDFHNKSQEMKEDGEVIEDAQPTDRARLAKTCKQLDQVTDDIQRYAVKVAALKITMSAAILSSASIIACTLSKAGSGLLEGLQRGFDALIVDEAAQAVELSSLIPIGQRVARPVLVGDRSSCRLQL